MMLILSSTIRKKKKIGGKTIREGEIKGIVITGKMMLYMKKFWKKIQILLEFRKEINKLRCH